MDENGKVVTIVTGKVNVSPRVLAILNGEVPVDELDDEELIRGFVRAKDGTFKGVPPKLVPKALHDKMVRELFARANDHLKANLMNAVQVMTAVAMDKDTDVKVRVDAAKWVIERTQGKTPDVTVNVSEAKWEQILNGIDRAAADEDILDAEIVDDGREP